jgi:hypothetical protein
MKNQSSLLLLLLACFIGMALSWTPPTPQTFWFSQTVDHFNCHQTQTFKQRYLIYDNYFNKGHGRIFFYAGNEGPIEV